MCVPLYKLCRYVKKNVFLLNQTKSNNADTRRYTLVGEAVCMRVDAVTQFTHQSYGLSVHYCVPLPTYITVSCALLLVLQGQGPAHTVSL